MPDLIDHHMNRVQHAAALAAQGFRIVPTKDKVAIAADFGADQPDATFGPEWFADADAVGILCGPCPALGDRRLICLDVDGDPKNCPAVNDLLQSLPKTLSSRSGAHRFFWVSAEHAAALKQWVDVLGTKAATGVAVDLKWEGGYACERGDWDVPVEVSAIAELPSPVRQTFVALRGESAERELSAEVPDAGLLRDAGFDPVVVLGDAAEWLTEAAPLPVDGKGGSALMVVMGALLVGFGLSAEDARELAMAFYYPRAWPGEDVDEKQLDHKIDEIERHGSTTFEPLQLAHAARNDRELAAMEAAMEADGGIPDSERISEAPVKAHGLTLVRAADLAKPRPPVNWLCDRLALTAGRPSIIAGAGGSGKTVVAQQLALSVAAGTSMFDQWPLERGPVLHLDLDQGEHATAVRYQQLARGMGLDLASLPLSCSFFEFYITKVDRDRRIGYSVDRGQMGLLRDTCRGHALVVIDSLRSVARGMDENDSEISEVVGAFSEIADTLKKEALVGGPPAPVFLLIHHSGKGTGSELRGSKAIEDKAGSVWTITRKPGEEVALWEQRKNSEFSFTPRVPFRTCVSYDASQDSVRIDLAPDMEEARAAEGGAEAAIWWTQAMDRALEIVRDYPGIHKRPLEDKIGGKREHARDLIDKLVLGDVSCLGAKLWQYGNSSGMQFYRDSAETLILEVLRAKGPCVTPTLQHLTQLPPQTIKDTCTHLSATGVIIKDHTLNNEPWALVSDARPGRI